MAVVSDKACRPITAAVAPGEPRRIRTFARERDVGGGIVPWPGQSAALPQRDLLGDVALFNGLDDQGVTGGFGIHSTLPGFMMPSGSSIALIDRISSIATLSLTSGSSSRLSTPIPCSAEIDPPIRSTMSNTTPLTSSQRARKSPVSAPPGCPTL